MSLIVIGDVHGCLKSLKALMEKLEPSAGDEIVFIGDYVDRGPDSKGVIDFVLNLQEKLGCVFLRGNHEALMLDYLNGDDYQTWLANGGYATLQSYAGYQSEIPDEHITFLRSTRFFFDTPEFFLVHAGLRPYLTVSEQMRRSNEEIFLWERSHLKATEFAWEKTVVCGHTPQPEPLNLQKLICIDTGCVYGSIRGLGHLTAVRLPERAFVQVPCMDY